MMLLRMKNDYMPDQQGYPFKRGCQEQAGALEKSRPGWMQPVEASRAQVTASCIWLQVWRDQDGSGDFCVNVFQHQFALNCTHLNKAFRIAQLRQQPLGIVLADVMIDAVRFLRY